jgi:hypothetical protein
MQLRAVTRRSCPRVFPEPRFTPRPKREGTDALAFREPGELRDGLPQTSKHVRDGRRYGQTVAFLVVWLDSPPELQSGAPHASHRAEIADRAVYPD